MRLNCGKKSWRCAEGEGGCRRLDGIPGSGCCKANLVAAIYEHSSRVDPV